MMGEGVGEAVTGKVGSGGSRIVLVGWTASVGCEVEAGGRGELGGWLGGRPVKGMWVGDWVVGVRDGLLQAASRELTRIQAKAINKRAGPFLGWQSWIDCQGFALLCSQQIFDLAFQARNTRLQICQPGLNAFVLLTLGADET